MATIKNPVNWFEIPVKDLGRATSFYERVLDCTISIQDFGGLTHIAQKGINRVTKC